MNMFKHVRLFEKFSELYAPLTRIVRCIAGFRGDRSIEKGGYVARMGEEERLVHGVRHGIGLDIERLAEQHDARRIARTIVRQRGQRRSSQIVVLDK